ncbi:MAG: hypothetical protein RLZZ148_2975 [Cyanobacteriota bacterium]
MPGQFLTKAEREQLSSFPTHPTEDNIITFFTLSTQELTIVKKRNGELNRKNTSNHSRIFSQST